MNGVEQAISVTTVTEVLEFVFYLDRDLISRYGDSFTDPNGRYNILDLSLREQWLTHINLYGFNSGEPNFSQEVYQKTLSFQNSGLLFRGDWNVVLEYSID